MLRIGLYGYSREWKPVCPREYIYEWHISPAEFNIGYLEIRQIAGSCSSMFYC